VDEQWKACGHSDTAEKFLGAIAAFRGARCMWVRLRAFFRLRTRSATLRMLAPVTVQRFEETINGREYRIEVSAVASNRWRAQIARAPGGSRAMMPFYGHTPDEAVQHLSRWLTLNHARKTPQV
jgi:hypothetical protein